MVDVPASKLRDESNLSPRIVVPFLSRAAFPGLIPAEKPRSGAGFSYAARSYRWCRPPSRG
jgi:hypothetical protein